MIGLLDLCASPHARFLLRLCGGIPRLLDALSVASDVPATGETEHSTASCAQRLAS